MGLASALTTALTGLNAAETQIDVVGNNLANSQTVGFKSSDVVFATQFLQTQSLGSGPGASDGGTNPRQTGLGVRVAEISPDFTQGTIEVSSNPSDLAIQGDGFFVVDGGSAGTLYSRNGIFKTNANSELVNVTGNRVLGFGVDDTYTVQKTTLVPLTIPLGSKAVAKATSVVNLEGGLTPTGAVANTAEVIESGILGDNTFPRPDGSAADVTGAPIADEGTVSTANSEAGAGTLAEGSVYQYRFVFVDKSGKETLPSDAISVTVPAGDTLANNTITLNNLPTDTDYANLRVYRTDAGGSTFFQIGTAAVGGSFVDNTPGHASNAKQLDTSSITGNYSYLVTFYDSSANTESRPSARIGPLTTVNGRIHLDNLPQIPAGTTYDQVRIYRNLATSSDSYYLVDTVNTTPQVSGVRIPNDFTDSKPDATISDLTITGNTAVDLDGPRIGFQTKLVDVIKRDGLTFSNVFEEGKLSFAGRKGGRQLASKDFEITSATTVENLLSFMKEAMGIQTQLDDPQHAFPNSVNTITGETGDLSPGATVTADGKIRIVGNNGVDNAVEIGLSAFKLTKTDNSNATIGVSFGSVQKAVGQSAVSDFVAYDSLGIPMNVRVTAVLQSVSDTETTYRWFADCGDNHTAANPDNDISVGTGLVTFDGAGNLIGTTNDRVTIQRRDEPSADPLEFKLDFSNVSGLAASKATLNASRQDGSSAGTLNSFIIGEDGLIRGVFSNGVTRDLGQIRLARFANTTGLEQVGQSLFRQGVNSGLPIPGDPGENGVGKIVAGARELSNTDVGKNMIDLVLATTQYRGNTRVITTAQQLLDELLNLRR